MNQLLKDLWLSCCDAVRLVALIANALLGCVLFLVLLCWASVARAYGNDRYWKELWAFIDRRLDS